MKSQLFQKIYVSFISLILLESFLFNYIFFYDFYLLYHFILIINIILTLHNQHKITGLIGEEERITVSTHDKNPDQVHARNLFPIVDTLTSITAYRRKLRAFTIRVCM